MVIAFAHTVISCLTLGAFFVLGISAINIILGKGEAFFTRSIALAAPLALVFSILTAAGGHINGEEIAKIQPAKLAAMESHWETSSRVPIALLTWPDEKNEGNYIEAIKVPGLLSVMAFRDFNAEVKGLKEFPPEDRPPVLLSFLSFRLMVGIGTVMPGIALLAWFFRKRIAEKKLFPLRLLLAAALPLPWLAILAGWVLTEVGRQPWIVYGVMRTADAGSPITAGQALGSLVLLTILFSVVLAVGKIFIGRLAFSGPPGDDAPAFLREGGQS